MSCIFVLRAKKKASRETCFFLSNPKDWHGITRRVYGIRRKATAWHTLCSPAAYAVALRALFRQRRNARGAICARSFTSELADSLRLIITRQRVFLLRMDYIQHFVLIPYRRQAADFIHGFALILRNLLNFKGTKESGIYMLLSLFCCVH